LSTTVKKQRTCIFEEKWNNNLMRKFLVHYFLPHESNNYRAKLLHHKSILFFITILFAGSFFFSFLKTNYSSVLGISSNISAQELLVITNQERQVNGLQPLQLNGELASAADSKASNMFTENYWAHESPSGTTPWVFIRNAGYNYVYAGENLARGFTNTSDVTNAWMASPTHRQNVLSPNYREVGFAIRTGTLNGEETVLVVEMFGSRQFAQVPPSSSQEIAAASSTTESTTTTTIAKEEPVQENKSQSLGIQINEEPKSQLAEGKQPFINSLRLSSSIVRIIVGLFILTLILDMFIVEKKKIVRFVGHNVDHIFFLSLVLILIGFLIKGAIA
jgi:uncharacterized protein YkwD